MQQQPSLALVARRLLLTLQCPKRRYTMALARNVPTTFPQALSSSVVDMTTNISYERAVWQHQQYLTELRKLVPTYVTPSSEDYPDCPFVEDTAIVINNKAVLTCSGAPSRRGEVDAVKDALLALGVDIVADMREIRGEEYEEATCDGGDVLYPVSHSSTKETTTLGGKHLFVGLSARTNLLGVQIIERAFPDIEVCPIPLPSSVLHLKSIVTHIDATTLLAPTGPIGDCVVKEMKARGYTVIRIPDMSCCNVISVNDRVVLAKRSTTCKDTRVILEKTVQEKNMELRYVESDEFEKCDGLLTCKSILLHI